jgi:hypothetical protein
MSDTNEKMHLKAEDIPDWVPSSVKSMAMAVHISYEGTVAHRLLTDPRMKSVWRELKKQEITRDALASLEPRERMSTWDITDRKLSPQDQACAAFYARVAIEFCSPRIVRTREQAKKSAKPWHDAARLCWHIMRYEFRPRIDAEFAQALAIVGEYLEKEGQMREQKNSPYIVERSSRLRRDDNIRVGTRLIGEATRSIFGSVLYGTVAKVASVALRTNISGKNVQNWCTASLSQ